MQSQIGHLFVHHPLVTRKALSGGYPLKLIMEEIDKLKSLVSLAMTWYGVAG